MNITVNSPILETPRVLQIRGIFDLPEAKASIQTWEVNLPIALNSWSVGLIVGPSGAGKSTIANAIWPERIQPPPWRADESILDSFPDDCGIKEITEILCSVGFSSPPGWLKPFHSLSTGEKFRVEMARIISFAYEQKNLPATHPSGEQHHTTIVIDEFTSVVDRNVAKIASFAVAKTVRAKALKLVAVSCHEDVEEWLCPDWVYRPAEQYFAWRSLRRPTITLEVFRCQNEAWRLFAPHHYLSSAHSKAAWSFLATWSSIPVAFSSWLYFVSGTMKNTVREHRTVTLPDYQGVGIGNALSGLIASMWRGLNYRAISTTTHPAMMRARCRSPNWTMTRSPSFVAADKGVKHSRTRLTAGFEYIGPKMNSIQAKALLGK